MITKTVKKEKGYKKWNKLSIRRKVLEILGLIFRYALLISLGMIILLLVVSLFIISNTIRITIFSRRLEISIMKSVGATNSFIRLPFMVEGIIIGVIAGVLATGAVWGIYEFALGSFTAVLSGFGSSAKIEFLDYALYLAVAFVGVGMFTGIFGSATSIRKYLKERKFVELED